jgi:hypothetical protein
MFGLTRKKREQTDASDEQFRVAQAQLRSLEDRSERALKSLEDRAGRNHWRESIERMIQGV